MNVDLPSRYISLFTGCGGLDLAVGLAIPNARCVCRVENDAAVARILAARMEEGSLEPSPVWSDVRTFDGKRWRDQVDGIVGGFPCTDLSVAGKQAGIDGEHSGLWWEFARIIREVQPGWVFIENVPPVLFVGAGRAVLGELHALGFDAEWLSVRASDVGAGHQRKRVFVLAYRRCELGQLQQWGIRRELARSVGELADSAQRGFRGRGKSPGSNRQPDGSNAELGNSPRTASSRFGSQRVNLSGQGNPELEDGPGLEGRGCEPGDAGEERTAAERAGYHLGDAPCERYHGSGSAGQGRRLEPSDAGSGIFAPGPSDPRWPGLIERYPFFAPATQPGIRLLADGMAFLVDASRTDQLRAAGNGVVAIQGAAALIELIRRVNEKTNRGTVRESQHG